MKIKHTYLHTVIMVAALSGCSAGNGEGVDTGIASPTPADPPTTPTPADPPTTPTPADPPTTPTPDDPPTTPTPTDPPADPPADAVTLEDLQNTVLTPICAQCHIGSSAPFGLAMDTLENSIANLIDVPSGTNPSILRIAPGDAQNSFLFMKITGDPLAGNRMPLGQSPLSEETIQMFRDWIDSGAPVPSSVPQINSVSVQKSQGKIVTSIKFSEAIEKSSLPDEAITLTTTKGQQGSEYLPTASDYTWRSTSSLEISIPAPTGDSDKLTITFNEPSGSTVMSVSGHWLDGDKNGTQGGVFTYEISL